MKKMLFYGLLLFIFSFGVGYYYSSIWHNRNTEGVGVVESQTINVVDNLKSTQLENKTMKNSIETASREEKISFDTILSLKKYYDECGHVVEEIVELPKEIINYSKEEVEDVYFDWNVEEFSKEKVVLSKEIDSLCDEHFLVKLGDEDNIEIYRVGNGGSFNFYKETNINKEFLTEDDIKNLEVGMLIYGAENLNMALEDFE